MRHDPEIILAAAALGDRFASLPDEPMTAEEARSEAVKCGRRVDICMAAGEFEEAKRQLAEAKRFSLLALKLDGDEQ